MASEKGRAQTFSKIRYMKRRPQGRRGVYCNDHKSNAARSVVRGYVSELVALDKSIRNIICLVERSGKVGHRR